MNMMNSDYINLQTGLRQWNDMEVAIHAPVPPPLSRKAKPATAEIGVQTEPVHIEPTQTEPPKEAMQKKSKEAKPFQITETRIIEIRHDQPTCVQ